MTTKKTMNSHLLKLLALLPIAAMALAMNARNIAGSPDDPSLRPTTTDTELPTGGATTVAADTVPGKVYDVVEQMPCFPSGDIAMVEYLRQNIRYPAEAHKEGIEGRVIATFVVEKDGSISDIVINRSVHPLLDEEAKRVIAAMPKWTPGRQNGQPVRVKYTIPISFRLNSGKPKTTGTTL